MQSNLKADTSHVACESTSVLAEWAFSKPWQSPVENRLAAAHLDVQ